MVNFKMPTKAYKTMTNMIFPIFFEGIIDVGNESLKVAEVDTATACFISLEYYGDIETTTAGKCNTSFMKLASFAKSCKDDTVNIETDNNGLIVRCGAMTITSPGYPIRSRNGGTPNVNSEVKVEIPVKDMVNISKSIPKDTELIRFEINNGIFYIEALNDVDQIEWVFSDAIVGEPKDLIVQIACEYFNDIVKGLSAFDFVVIGLKGEFPVIFNANNDDFNLEYIVAPRVSCE